MFTLGINAAYHDCAAALVQDGKVIAAAEEERFTHVKHGKRPVPFTAWQLPFHAVDYCLREAGIELNQIDRLAYSFDPAVLHDGALPDQITLPLEPSAQTTGRHNAAPWEPLFLSSVVNAPRQLCSGAPHHLQARFRNLNYSDIRRRWQFVEHHLAHEASAFLAAPFSEAAVLTMDGRGERATTSYGLFVDGKGNDAYRRIKQIDMPHSLGLLYEAVTSYLGFLHSCDEYKVMALASYGRPVYRHVFEEWVQVQSNGSYRIVPENLPQHLVERFGPARLRGAPLEQRHFDLAHSLQQVLENSVLSMAQWLHSETCVDQLCMAGGVALNCVMNSRLLKEGPFRKLWVQPAAGDAGTALGAALWVDYCSDGGRRRKQWQMDHAYLGPVFNDSEIEQFLRWAKIPFRALHNVAEETAALLAQEKIVGWFQGRMEFGPRALGARSILASPRQAIMQARLNEIKDREDFRPVAPVVLEERAEQWFVPLRDDAGVVSPFMLFVYDVRPDKAGRIPAVRHVDGTARVQTINRRQHALYYDLVQAFEARTGVPVLINTSFNTRGEPIVCTPRDAVECFWTSPLDALVIGSCLLEKPAP